MKDTLINHYISIAKETAKLSYCQRRKVGAVIVSQDGNNILGYGYNGTVSGMPNVCELNDGTTDNQSVLHAETNAIMKVCKSTQSTQNAILFVTLSPCIECAKLIIQAGISTVYYTEEYKDITGLSILHLAGVDVVKV